MALEDHLEALRHPLAAQLALLTSIPVSIFLLGYTCAFASTFVPALRTRHSAQLSAANTQAFVRSARDLGLLVTKLGAIAASSSYYLLLYHFHDSVAHRVRFCVATTASANSALVILFVLQPLTRDLQALHGVNDTITSDTPEHTLECASLLDRWRKGCWLLVRLQALASVLELWSLGVEAGHRDPADYIGPGWWWALASMIAVYTVVIPSVKAGKLG